MPHEILRFIFESENDHESWFSVNLVGFCLRCGHVFSDPASGGGLQMLAHVDMLVIEPVRS
ncbi:hypothetical protein SLEP1_g23454 [Rubroshorea leprosula]|uniref:Uncharacterized protein n=1 Tax=Rubroshorea leprosula TaxID=152421 RepID=A0AAV5JIM1_9ROSI|nr:hypothetical protein SLEP1_g23454 [Rubroshorea leprosula]